MKIDLEALKNYIYYQDKINQNIFGKIYQKKKRPLF